MYEPDGYMCATIVNGDRPAWKDPARPPTRRRSPTTTPSLPIAEPYKLDSAASTVTHYPEIAWEPAYVGSTQPRPFRLEGNKLIITATRGISDSSIQKRVLVWQRAK